MKNVRKLVYSLLAVVFASTASGGPLGLFDDYETMKGKGLFADIAVHVADLNGDPIENASVQFFFCVNGKYETVKAKTNSDGYASARRRVNIDVIIDAGANGFYEARQRHFILSTDRSKMKNGEWILENPLFEFRLCNIRNPVKPIWRYHFSRFALTNRICKLKLPENPSRSEFVILPKDAEDYDFLVEWNVEEDADETRKIRGVKMRGEGGFQIIKRNDNQKLLYQYELPVDGYADYYYSSVFKQGKLLSSLFDDHKESLALKLPITTEDGILGFRYGIVKILRMDIDVKRGYCSISMHYTLNEKLGDRNSEYVR